MLISIGCFEQVFPGTDGRAGITTGRRDIYFGNVDIQQRFVEPFTYGAKHRVILANRTS